MKVNKNISEVFFLAILLSSLYFCYLIFKPFLGIIFVAGALSVSLYTPYKKILQLVKSPTLASTIMSLFVVAVIILPLLLFFFLLSKSSLEAYSTITSNVTSENLNNVLQKILHYFNLDIQALKIQFSSYVADFNKWVVSGIATFVRSTTQFIVKLFIMVLTMFFLFRDGKQLLEKIIHLTPLEDKYDREIFEKFREVSYSALVSSLITGLVQGLVAGIAFAIVGVPYILFGIATVFASFIPFVGVSIVWVPVSIYLLLIGKWPFAIFMFLYGALVISMIDNLLRPLLMKGRTQIHPMLLFFAIFGGIMLFGFWGIIFGPLIISVALTLLHIYEVEYCALLDGCAIKKTRKPTRKRKTTRIKSKV